ncbi:MAG: DUF1460 domain-containing protein [Longimicrobiales bacterium]|nr:DUF1460 domain-containing protein [Longimicrobiales bacterium]
MRTRLLPLLALGVIACAEAPVEREAAPATDIVYPGDALLTDTLPGTPWTRADWEIFSQAIEIAERDLRARELPLGEAIGQIGTLFVGFPYTPQTLESPWFTAASIGTPLDGSLERLVVNLREFDCVTFVENVLALTWFVREHGAEALADPARAREIYEAYLTRLRYRGGTLDGYASRLHYFSEWIADNAARGSLALTLLELDPALDPEPIDFMTAHVEAYPALAGDPRSVDAIREVEARLNAAGPRPWIPEERIASVSERIRTGDVIAATSTIGGLDVAHTGIALRIDGVLHLMHAPLVGRDVQISEVSLADRILRIGSQDGVLVARPLEG